MFRKKNVRLRNGTSLSNIYMSYYGTLSSKKNTELSLPTQKRIGQIHTSVLIKIVPFQSGNTGYTLYVHGIHYLPHQTWKIKSTCVVSIHCSGIWLECPTCSGCTWRHYARCPIPLITKSHRNVHLTGSRSSRNAG